MKRLILQNGMNASDFIQRHEARRLRRQLQFWRTFAILITLCFVFLVLMK